MLKSVENYRFIWSFALQSPSNKEERGVSKVNG